MARISLFSRRLFIYSSNRYGDSRFHRRLSGYRVCLCSPHSTEDLLHSVSISGLGRIAHRQRQQFTDLVVPALHGAHLLSSLSASSAGHSAILFCAAGRHSGTGPGPRRSRCLSNPAPGAKSKCFAPAPADRQRRQTCTAPHIFSPLCAGGWWWYFPFPLTECSAVQVLRAKPLSAEIKVRKIFRAAGNDKNCRQVTDPPGKR